ncbi:MAG: glycoside hydrolase N-terminal domain-containing protein, partial [Bacteroidaceae bacterium]|nr:glycoside hydrolase N-terminal domain-containing protein [Bacteroidaceae bacterium]
MNQWSGAGAYKELGSWDAYDPNNPLEFVLPSDVVINDKLPTTLAEYKYAASISYTPSNQVTLWYTKPTTSETVSNPWMDYALPIGNGQFGGMVYGGIHQDVLQFNEKTLWTGSSTVRGAYQNFGQLY